MEIIKEIRISLSELDHTNLVCFPKGDKMEVSLSGDFRRPVACDCPGRMNVHRGGTLACPPPSMILYMRDSGFSGYDQPSAFRISPPSEYKVTEGLSVCLLQDHLSIQHNCFGDNRIKTFLGGTESPPLTSLQRLVSVMLTPKAIDSLQA